jgi:hypothetical protein
MPRHDRSHGFGELWLGRPRRPTPEPSLIVSGNYYTKTRRTILTRRRSEFC